MNEDKMWNKIEKGIFVIAEIGKNFIQTKEEKDISEYLENAQKLILLAKEAGADAVKFQTHNLEDEQMSVKIVSPHFSASDRYNWVKRNDLATPNFFWYELKKYADKIGITFFSTPMSRGAAMRLDSIGVPLWKVGSGDILDFVMLDFLATTKKPVIISSGMSTFEEIDKSVEFLKRRNSKVAILHCVSKYPCPPSELNLNTIKFLKKRYNIPVGFSDHSIDYNSSLASIHLGATIVEKHFSLSRDLWGSDHKVSLTPDEFKIMVEKIRRQEFVATDNLGEDIKKMNPDELVFRSIFRKSLVAARDIYKGEIITGEMVYAMRPQEYIDALPSEEYENILGRTAVKKMAKYEGFKFDLLN